MKRYLAGVAAVLLLAGCTGQPAPRTPGPVTQQGIMGGRDSTGQHQEGLLELGAGTGIRAGAVTGSPTVVIVGRRALISGMTGLTSAGVGTEAVGDGGGTRITGQRPTPTTPGVGTMGPTGQGLRTGNRVGTGQGAAGVAPMDTTATPGTPGVAPGEGTPGTGGRATTWNNNDHLHQVAAQVRAQRPDVTEVRVTINQTQEQRLQAIAAALRSGESLEQHRAELEKLATQMQPLSATGRPRVGAPLAPRVPGTPAPRTPRTLR